MPDWKWHRFGNIPQQRVKEEYARLELGEFYFTKRAQQKLAEVWTAARGRF